MEDIIAINNGSQDIEQMKTFFKNTHGSYMLTQLSTAIRGVNALDIDQKAKANLCVLPYENLFFKVQKGMNQTLGSITSLIHNNHVFLRTMGLEIDIDTKRKSFNIISMIELITFNPSDWDKKKALVFYFSNYFLNYDYYKEILNWIKPHERDFYYFEEDDDWEDDNYNSFKSILDHLDACLIVANQRRSKRIEIFGEFHPNNWLDVHIEDCESAIDRTIRKADHRTFARYINQYKEPIIWIGFGEKYTNFQCSEYRSEYETSILEALNIHAGYNGMLINEIYEKRSLAELEYIDKFFN